ncbi:MAG: MFS transporter [Armatimonadetes bacterium]|nr:MFS transporter [Armatimonadota bacterium]
MIQLRVPPALQQVEFRRYLAGAFISNVGSNIQAWAIGWHVYQLTHQSYMVGLLGLVRVGPLVVFSLFGGVLADHADRRKIMLATQTAMATIAGVLAITSWLHLVSVYLIYAMVGLFAIARSFDGPARQALQVNLVPKEIFPNAASMNGVAWRLSDVLGPIITGVLVGFNTKNPTLGLTMCYSINSLSFLALIYAVWRTPYRYEPSIADRPRSVQQVIRQIGEGIKFVNRTPVVRSAMWIDFWATFLSGAEALLPAFAATVLGLGASGYGVLAASSGVGALIAASGLTYLPTITHQGRVVVTMIALFGLATIGFGAAPNLWVASVCLALVGASDMISTVLRQTIRQLATPDDLRGRMNATSSLFHISGPQLGDYEAGLIAHSFGERFSIILGGSLCLFVAAHWSRAKALTGYVHRAD